MFSLRANSSHVENFWLKTTTLRGIILSCLKIKRRHFIKSQGEKQQIFKERS